MTIPTHIQKHLAAADPALEEAILAYSNLIPPITKHTRIYEELISSIMGQQLSGKAADAIRKKFLAYYNNSTPAPQVLVQATLEELRPLGLSGQKAGYIKNVAQFWIDNSLEQTNWLEMDEDAIIELLTQIKGVGKWTVEMVLIFDLGRDDVFPVDDLGVVKGMELLYKKRIKAKGFKKWALRQSAKWSPYRSWGSRLMWKAYDNRIK